MAEGTVREPPDGLWGDVPAAWAARRNAAGAAVAWPFTTADAQTKLKRLYPAIES